MQLTKLYVSKQRGETMITLNKYTVFKSGTKLEAKRNNVPVVRDFSKDGLVFEMYNKILQLELELKEVKSEVV